MTDLTTKLRYALPGRIRHNQALLDEAERIYESQISPTTGKPGITRQTALVMAMEARFKKLDERLRLLERAAPHG